MIIFYIVFWNTLFYYFIIIIFDITLHIQYFQSFVIHIFKILLKNMVHYSLCRFISHQPLELIHGFYIQVIQQPTKPNRYKIILKKWHTQILALLRHANTGHDCFSHTTQYILILDIIIYYLFDNYYIFGVLYKLIKI